MDEYIWDYETDIIVVGSGAAAYSAAITSAQLGSQVIMVEKGTLYGGTTLRSGGGFWIPNNLFQKEKGIIDSEATLWQGFPPLPVQGIEAPYIISGNSIDELSKNIDSRLALLSKRTGGFSLDSSFSENLKKTVTRFNEFANSGIDLDFHRGNYNYDREWTTFPPTIPGAEWPPQELKNYTMYPLSSSGPYYAIILGAGTLDTNGGPVINEKAQVLNTESKPIPGLYGAGDCIASPTANAYWGAGSTIGPALTFGYIAGINASKEPIK